MRSAVKRVAVKRVAVKCILRGVVIALAAGLVGLVTASGAPDPAAAVRPDLAAAVPGVPDHTWLVTAYQSNLGQIAAGYAAEVQATDAEVKRLGHVLVTDGEQFDRSLALAARRLGISLPSAPTPAQQVALQLAHAQSGREFDTAWVASQLSLHKDMAAATQAELSSGDSTIVRLARLEAPVVAKHLAQLRTLASSYGVPGGVAAGSDGQAAGGSSGPGALLGIAGIALLGVVGYALRRRQPS